MPTWKRGRRKPRIKTLNGIPNHFTYREKLREKYRRKGYTEVRFC